MPERVPAQVMVQVPAWMLVPLPVLAQVPVQKLVLAQVQDADPGAAVAMQLPCSCHAVGGAGVDAGVGAGAGAAAGAAAGASTDSAAGYGNNDAGRSAGKSAWQRQGQPRITPHLASGTKHGSACVKLSRPTHLCCNGKMTRMLIFEAPVELSTCDRSHSAVQGRQRPKSQGCPWLCTVLHD